MSKKLLSLHGLKFNPFSAQVPTEALWTSPPVESFCWRIEQAHLREGGFALAMMAPTMIMPEMALVIIFLSSTGST